MLKPTDEQVNSYVRFLKDREQRLRADLGRVERAINRIQKKLENPEKSLLNDIREGGIIVSKVTGIPLPTQKTKDEVEKESALVTGETHEMELKGSAPAAPAKQKKEKGLFSFFEDEQND